MTLRERLVGGGALAAVEIASGSAAVVELAGGMGFDLLVLDARHAAVSPFSGELEDLVRAATAARVPALVRVPEASPGTLNRALNDGASGLIVPAVESAADALAAVHASRYPPAGRRGAAPVVRAARFGLTPWDDYRETVNAENVVLASLESPAGLAAAAEVVAVDGLDGVVLIALDLALATGGSPASPDGIPGAAAAIAAVAAAGKVCAAAVADPAHAAAWRDAGCGLVVLGSDLAACAEAMTAMRSSLEIVPRSRPRAGGAPIDLRAAVDAGDVVLGCFALLVEPVFVEQLGHAGFDYVILDCEESGGDSYGLRLEQLARAADASGLVVTTRPVENTPGAINRSLNAGSRCVFVPHVRNAAEAKAMVDAARYPPLGRRGAAPVVRAARFGMEPWEAYLERTNRENLVIAMIEDVEAVEHIEEIVAVPGLDGILVGTWDLAVELGCADYGPPAPPVMEHVAHVIDVTRRAGLVMSAHCWSADAAVKYVELGCQILIVSLDSTLLLQGLRSLQEDAAALRG
ncbi:MAG: aldolase/citrate lyase family protein [Thermoleophilia bacterium]